jgi:hypothetical protein
VEDGQPVRIRTGQAGHFLKKNGASDRDFRFGTNGSSATKDPNEVFVAENLKGDVGSSPVCGEMGQPGADFFYEIAVVDNKAEML